MKKSVRRTLFAMFLSLAILYAGLYLTLSLGGRYEPATIGLSGVKSYMWAPRSFYEDMTWQRTPEVLFLPLYFLDIKLWHTSNAAYSGDYPLSEVK